MSEKELDPNEHPAQVPSEEVQSEESERSLLDGDPVVKDPIKN